MCKATLFLTTLLSLSTGCTDDSFYDFCIDKVSAQTATPKQNLAKLTCTKLMEKLPLPLPKDYIVLQDKNAVFFTHCSLTNHGTSRLQENQHCYEKIHDFLGMQPITQCIMEAMGLEGDLSELESMYVSSQKEGAAGCLMIRSAWFGEKKEKCLLEEEITKVKTKVNSCAPHEPTHLFVAGTVLNINPPWLNEGLADYVIAQLHEGITLECFADSFRFISENQTKVGSYVPLNKGREEHESNETAFDAYLTGACLWGHIDKTYGHETFKAIMQDVDASRFSYLSFVNDILMRSIGEKGVNDLKKKFGKDSIEAFE